jgi:protein TonB
MTDVAQLLESRRARVGRWVAAGVIVCALHLGGAALALMHWPEDDDVDDAAGALTVDLAPIPSAMPVDSPDVAHGPLQEEAALAQQAVKEVVKEVVKDTAKLDPSPATEPEIVLPKPEPEKDKPKEEAKEPEKQKQQDTAAPLTTAPPRVDAPATTSSTPSLGQSAVVARVQASWQRTLVHHLERFKRYPEAARSQRAQGVVVVAFTLDRAGQVTESRVTQSSGSPALDAEALDVLKRASPLPAPPEQLTGPFDLSLPIQFRIR